MSFSRTSRAVKKHQNRSGSNKLISFFRGKKIVKIIRDMVSQQVVEKKENIKKS